MLAGSEGSVSGVLHHQQILHAPIVSDADCELLVLPTGGAALSSKSIELGWVSLETKPEHRDERAPPHCAAQDFFLFHRPRIQGRRTEATNIALEFLTCMIMFTPCLDQRMCTLTSFFSAKAPVSHYFLDLCL